MFYIHDLGALESWEVADLDESMSRLMLSSSSSKKDSSSSSFLDASVPASAFASAPNLLSSLVLVGSGMIYEDSINQMDQFLREALQNPRERLSNSYPPLKKGRGPTRGKGTDTIVQMSGKIKLDFNTESGRPKDSDKSAKFSNECGYLIRKFAPLQFEKWSAIPAMDTQPLVDRLLSKFDLDMSKTYITKYVHEIMGQRYRTYRYDLHQHFKQFETVEEARLHPPDDVTQEDWDYLCNLFSLEKFKKRATINSENREKLPFNHRGGSKPFAFHRQHNSMSVATGELQGEVELFRATHYNESKGWINDTTKSRYEEMRKLQEQSTQDGDTPISDLEITQRVLGKRSGYIRGLGYGSRLKRSTTTEFPDEETERLRQQITKLEEFKTTATTQLEELKAMIQTLMPQQTNTSNQPPPHSSSTSQPPPSPSS